MNNNLFSKNITLVWDQTMGSIINYFPKAVFAILTAILGVILGNFIRQIILKTLQLVKFEQAIKDNKFQLFLKKAEITHKLEDLIANSAKWLVVLIFFISATNIAGLTSISDVLTSILSYVPRIISAVIVLALGILLAGVVEGLVKGSLASIDLKTSRLMGKISSYAIVIIATLTAFSEMGIATSFINILFVGTVSMLALGFGLALGLGSKDLVNKLMTDWYKRVQKELRD